MASQQIDRNKLRAAVRKLGREYVFYMPAKRRSGGRFQVHRRIEVVF
jgi:hypothetical protein